MIGDLISYETNRKEIGTMLINRAPVLTLWATVVAKRMGYSEDEALTLGKAVAGYTAQFKGRSLGIYTVKEKSETGEERTEKREAKLVDLMGRKIPTIEERGEIRSISKDKAVDPDSVRRYLDKKFGENLDEFAAAMEALAKSYDPEELNATAFRLYEKFRPEIPKGKRGWGAKGELNLEKIRKLMKE
jgi:hypothetical protein